jgi:hypothetical protein
VINSNASVPTDSENSHPFIDAGRILCIAFRSFPRAATSSANGDAADGVAIIVQTARQYCTDFMGQVTCRTRIVALYNNLRMDRPWHESVQRRKSRNKGGLPLWREVRLHDVSVITAFRLWEMWQWKGMR